MTSHIASKAMLAAVAALALSGCVSSTTLTPALAPSPASYRETVVADHPVAYWRMDERSGTIMADSTSHHHTGTYVGLPALGQAGPMSAAAGVAFAGGQTYATVPDAPDLRLKTVTIELWLKKRSNSEYGVYVSKNVVAGAGPGTGWFTLLNHGHDGRLEFRVAGDETTMTSTATLTLNTWYYVVGTYDGTTARLFIDGTLDSSADLIAVPKETADPVYLGRRIDGWSSDATLSQVAIYPVALPAQRIAAHWQAATR